MQVFLMGDEGLWGIRSRKQIQNDKARTGFRERGSKILKRLLHRKLSLVLCTVFGAPLDAERNIRIRHNDRRDTGGAVPVAPSAAVYSGTYSSDIIPLLSITPRNPTA